MRGSGIASLHQFLEPIMRAGRDLLSRARGGGNGSDSPDVNLLESCRELLAQRGEASGLALADEILVDYQVLESEDRLAFLGHITDEFAESAGAVAAAAHAYLDTPGFDSLRQLKRAIESPRLKLLRRLNTAPGGTRRLVALRADVLALLRTHPQLRPLDVDLRELFLSWFNRGFLSLERIDWRSSAELLEKLVAYEAVHEINGLEDLRTRLAGDRRCFAFFHPAMPDDPIIFLQVALTTGVPAAIAPLIGGTRDENDALEADTAVFYSISNCHEGLRGISFGNFLIKQVVEELRRELENVRHFVTLSPVTGFRQWVRKTSVEALPEQLHENLRLAKELDSARGQDDFQLETAPRAALIQLCAHYLLNERRELEPLDPVARFHLGNGAVLDRINWNADASPKGRERSFGIMVNYAYRPGEIASNHERYFSEGWLAASTAVRRLAPAG